MTGHVRRWWYLIAVLLLVAGGSVGYLVSAGGAPPSDVVAAYLHALARGDAAAALALGEAPPDRALLSDTVLAEQQRLAPISHILVLGTETGASGAVVRVRYHVGARPVTNHVVVLREGTRWVLRHVAVDIEISGAVHLREPTVFGRPVGGGSDVYVFPGAVRFGSADADFALDPPVVVFTEPDMPAMARPHAQLSAAGRTALTAVLRSALQQCAASRSLAPPHCPQRASRPAGPGLVATSFRWRPPSGYGGLDITVDSRTPGLAHVSGTLTWTLSYSVRPAHARHSVARSRTVRSTLAATVDFTARPPALRLG